MWAGNLSYKNIWARLSRRIEFLDVTFGQIVIMILKIMLKLVIQVKKWAITEISASPFQVGTDDFGMFH